jgi:uncharacterized protein (TIGR03067 family)
MALDLTGTWHGVYAEVDGEALSASYSRGVESTYQVNEFSIKIHGKVEHEGTYSINEKVDPNQITFVYTKSSHFELNKPRTGILQLAGTTYKNCIGAIGAKVPHGFNTAPNSNTVLTVLQKKGAEAAASEAISPQVGPRILAW